MRYEAHMDPELWPGLDLYEAFGFAEQDLSGDNIAVLRERVKQVFTAAVAEIPPNDRVTREDRRIPGPEGAPEVPVRIYRPAEPPSATLPGVLWIHGGGMLAGFIDMDDVTCDTLVERVGCVVVSVDYRLAPEHPDPAPVEDCFAALRWVAGAAEDLRIDPARIAVARASAGGGLAAGTVLLARDRGSPPVAFQLLVYPMLDDRNDTASAREFRGILSWSHEHNHSGWKALLGDRAGGDDVSPYAAPARATDLSGLPPALVQVGELEVFLDEDIEYAHRLLRAKVPTELHVYPGAYHASDVVAPTADASVRMLEERVRALRRALHADVHLLTART